MSVLVLVTKSEDIRSVVSWGAEFAKARGTTITIMCWTYSSMEQPEPGSVGESLSDPQLANEVRTAIQQSEPSQSLVEMSKSGGIEFCCVSSPTASTAATEFARNQDVELIVAASEDPSGETGGTYATNPLLRNSPCHTVILFGGANRSLKTDRVFVGASDRPHDAAALFLASRMGESLGSHVTLARAEMAYEHEAVEVGKRELNQMVRDAGVTNAEQIECQVFRSRDYWGMTTSLEKQDLVLLSANNPNIHLAIELTSTPTIAVIKRAPPIRPWRSSKRSREWRSRLSPSDYVDLIQGLRRGSRLSGDFLTMLGLASVVASMGLLQDSPAVVIGSMLLAPLMTPMLGCGLALAQANPKLGNKALTTVLFGLLCTLAVSLILGLITPGSELTPQILSRGEPTALDLVVAVASAAAASYALARPNLVGSIAGVAIATALVPPLCSVGLSLAYANFSNAIGAALLFGTNFVAIVLGAGVMFRIMGVTPARADSKQKFWVVRTVSILGVVGVLFFIPLHLSLMKSLGEAKPQPRSYPLTWVVTEALEEHIAKTPDVELISAGRPSSPFESSDVVLVLGTPRELDRSFAKRLVEIVRDQMMDDSLVVEVHCIRELWQETGGLETDDGMDELP